jgi:CHASE3 domain sensor protein
MEQNQVPQLEIVNTGMDKKILFLLGIFGVLLIGVAVVVYLQYEATKEIDSDITQINNNITQIGIGST